MARLTIGITPIQLAWGNPKRKKWELQFIPSSIIAGNTGLLYVKRGSAPVADIASNTWDHVLNAGAGVGDNTDDSLPEAPFKGSIWVISDTAGQIISFIETNVEEKKS